MQRLTSSIDLGANEVQTITTSVVDVNEVQIITTSTSKLNEIQEITVSPPSGALELDPSWSYALQLDTSSVGGSLQYSGQISSTAPASGSRDSLAEKISSMMNVDNGVIVTKSSQNNDGGYTYAVTFPYSMKNPPVMEVFLSDIPVRIDTVEEGNLISGSFRLGFEGEVTEDINFDADASEMQTKLENLSTIESVNVYRGPADDQNGYSWEIEFTSNLNSGDLSDLVTYNSGLSSSNPSGETILQVIEGGTDGSYIRGSFKLEFGKYLILFR